MKVLRYGELDRPVLTAAALRVAERDGIDRLTVRSLALELGLSHSAIYHYVRGKGEVLDLVAEAVLSDVALPESGPWQLRLREFAHSSRRSLLRVDGIAGVLQTRPVGDAAARIADLMHQLVTEAGVPPRRRESAQMLLSTFVTGSVSLEQELDGLPHSLRTSGVQRFDQGLDVIIAGLEAGG